MTSKQTVVILIASLLASVHCQTLAALVELSSNHKGHMDMEDDDDVSRELNKLENTLPDTPEDLQFSADSREVSADQKDTLPVITDDPHDSADTPKDSEDLEAAWDNLKEALDEPADTTDMQGDPEGRSYAVGLFIRQLLPIIASGFFDALSTVIFNWFFPFKVVPPPPGLLGVSQLWGGQPHPKHWHHHWGHLHLGPGKWGNGNWGHAYWGPAYSRHTPPASPAHGYWEPHPHAHL